MQNSSDQLLDREREFFANYYESQIYSPAAWHLRMERELRSLLRANRGERLGRVLSVGCGNGRFEVMVARHAEHVVGIDLSPEAVRIAQAMAREHEVGNVEFFCGPAGDFAPDELFDSVLCIAFLHHVPESDVLPFLRTLHSRIAPGGLLYTQDPNINGVLRTIGRFILGKSYHRYHTPDERELDPKELAHLLREAGFSGIETRGIDLTILPLGYMFPRAPSFLFKVCATIDRLWCATPLTRWASGFTAAAYKPSSTL